MSLGANVQGSNNWGTLTRNVSPYLYGTEDDLVNQIHSLMMGGANPAVSQMKTAAADQVNRGFASAPRTIASKLSGLGFGKSGKLGTALYGLDSQRLGDLSSQSSQYDQIGLNEQNYGSNLAQQLLGSTMGATTFGGNRTGGASLQV